LSVGVIGTIGKVAQTRELPFETDNNIQRLVEGCLERRAYKRQTASVAMSSNAIQGALSKEELFNGKPSRVIAEEIVQ